MQRYVEGLRHEFDENRRRPPLRPNEPPFAGSAVWAHSLARGVEEAWSHLKNLRHMAKASARTLASFAVTLDSVSEVPPVALVLDTGLGAPRCEFFFVGPCVFSAHTLAMPSNFGSRCDLFQQVDLVHPPPRRDRTPVLLDARRATSLGYCTFLSRFS